MAELDAMAINCLLASIETLARNSQAPVAEANALSGLQFQAY